MAWMIEFQGPSFAYKDYVYFLGQLERARLRGEARIEVSFDRVSFFYPDGMAPFVAMVNHVVAQGLSVGVGEPATRELLDYWGSVGWLDHLQGTNASLHRGRSYLPLTAYRVADELNSFINDTLDLLAQSQAFPQGVLTGFEWSINEIADNVLVHADSDEPGWLQMTSYPEAQKVEFVVVDTGRGIRASLSESHPDLKSDEQAVATAIEKGTTRDRSVGQGNGLSGTIRIASGASGFVNIHSSRGQVRLLGQTVHRDTVAPHQGTLVTVTLPTGAEINVSEARKPKGCLTGTDSPWMFMPDPTGLPLPASSTSIPDHGQGVVRGGPPNLCSTRWPLGAGSCSTSATRCHRWPHSPST